MFLFCLAAKGPFASLIGNFLKKSCWLLLLFHGEPLAIGFSESRKF